MEIVAVVKSTTHITKETEDGVEEKWVSELVGSSPEDTKFDAVKIKISESSELPRFNKGDEVRLRISNKQASLDV